MLFVAALSGPWSIHGVLQLVRQSISVLMEGAPEGISPDAVEGRLLSLAGVAAVHDLHIWSLSVGKPALSVHLAMTQEGVASAVLHAASLLLANEFNVHHTTIQVELPTDGVTCNPRGLPHSQVSSVLTDIAGPSRDGALDARIDKKPAYGTF